MSFVSDTLAKVKDLAQGVWMAALGAANFVKTLPGKLSALIPHKHNDESQAGIEELLQKLIPANLKRIILAGKTKFLFFGLVAALFILAICLVAAVSGMNRGSNGPVRGTSPLGRAAIHTTGAMQPVIPPEELFFPEEPDFLPGFIPERERREAWTTEDAAPFWYNPLEKDEEQWRNRIESVIDELLEHVP
jgi:hypothetical protein